MGCAFGTESVASAACAMPCDHRARVRSKMGERFASRRWCMRVGPRGRCAGMCAADASPGAAARPGLGEARRWYLVANEDDGFTIISLSRGGASSPDSLQEIFLQASPEIFFLWGRVRPVIRRHLRRPQISEVQRQTWACTPLVSTVFDPFAPRCAPNMLSRTPKSPDVCTIV